MITPHGGISPWYATAFHLHSLPRQELNRSGSPLFSCVVLFQMKPGAGKYSDLSEAKKNRYQNLGLLKPGHTASFPKANNPSLKST